MSDGLIDSRPYKRPPITEAVIELRFAKPIDDADLAKLSDRFDADYPLHQLLKNVQVQIQLDAPTTPAGGQQASVTREIIAHGHRRTSTDVSEILLILPTSFLVSQLAPYPGWRTFSQRFSRDWVTWNKACGQRKKIGRVGVRFINRVDIPITGAIIEDSDYLGIYPKLSSTLGPVAAYAMQTQLPADANGFNVIINSASVPSPLLGSGSIVIDIDIGKELNANLKDEELFDLLNAIRIKKNSIFEACITDRARELFQS